MQDNHPLAQEEVMAFLDGELTTDRAAAAAAHLEHCRECQDLAAHLQGVSRRLKEWGVESSDTQITNAIAVALGESRPQAMHRTFRPPKWVWGIAASVFVIVALLSTVSRRPPLDLAVTRQPAASVMLPAPVAPKIARTAQLIMTTKDFDKARAAVEDIVKRHKGYIGQLQITAHTGSGRTLDATLRIPAGQLEPTMSEIKRLGQVESESLTGEEVTAQYIDLDARLSNARNTEKRLTELLRQRTGKLADVMSVELEIGRVRGEIERMEAEKKNLVNRVDFATLNTTVREKYESRAQAGPFSVLARFRNAAVDGYRSTVESVVGLIAFLLSYGPILLAWAAILFFPLRFVWRRARRNPAG